MMTGERESERVILRGLCQAYLHGNDMRHARAREYGTRGDDAERGRKGRRCDDGGSVVETVAVAVAATIGAARFVYRG